MNLPSWINIKCGLTFNELIYAPEAVWFHSQSLIPELWNALENESMAHHTRVWNLWHEKYCHDFTHWINNIIFFFFNQIVCTKTCANLKGVKRNQVNISSSTESRRHNQPVIPVQWDIPGWGFTWGARKSQERRLSLSWMASEEKTVERLEEKWGSRGRNS